MAPNFFARKIGKNCAYFREKEIAMPRHYYVYSLHNPLISVNGGNLQDLDYCNTSLVEFRNRYVWILNSKPKWIKNCLSQGKLPEIRILDIVEGIANAKRRKKELLVELTGLDQSPDEMIYLHLPRGTTPRHYYILGEEQEGDEEDEE